MKKTVLLSLVLSNVILANEAVVLEEVQVQSTHLSDIAQEEIKSGDLSQTLVNKIPSISLVRRSGIANDIILRGQKKDNINVLIDNGKIYGACPNRMDPATSHILTNNIDSINVIEGPYDVENFGTLSGAIKITTKKPVEEFAGELNLNYGSFNYKKASMNLEGGTETMKLLISASTESSDQYRDGNGDTTSQQLINATKGTPFASVQYKESDKSAYEKKTFMSKIYIDFTDDQELVASYTMNRSDDILYPSSKMDAIYDDSKLYNVEYNIKNIANFSKKLTLQYYNSLVDHPMSTEYRKSSLMMGEIRSALTSSIQGLKVINRSDISDTMDIKIGIDGSIRNWNGDYLKDGKELNKKSIDNVDTQNMALFTQLTYRSDKLKVESGLRLDNSKISVGNSIQSDNNYQSVSANIMNSYTANKNVTLFAGVGKASRLPDARELYFRGMMGNVVGNETLDDTDNYEVDLGMKNSYENFQVKTKIFYSYLKNYIYYNSSSKNAKGLNESAFENIDASIYGMDVSGTFYMTDTLSSDFGAAYQRGRKSSGLKNQDNINLAEIAPFKANVSLNFEYYKNSMATLDVIGSDRWRYYDYENGEQAIASWTVLNAKLKHTFNKYVETTFGVDNVFDKTYAVSNTYQDLTLVGADDSKMLLNEPGRYYYINLKVKF